MRLGFLFMRSSYTNRKMKVRKSNFNALRPDTGQLVFDRGRLCYPAPLLLALPLVAFVVLSRLPRISGTAALASSVNAATMLLAEESFRRNIPISNTRLFPR